jgi:hypothetical protein
MFGAVYLLAGLSIDGEFCCYRYILFDESENNVIFSCINNKVLDVGSSATKYKTHFKFYMELVYQTVLY